MTTTQTQIARRPPGRPRKFPEGREKITSRFTPEMIARIKQRADVNRRSLSEQVETMVSELFNTEEILAAVRTNAAQLKEQVFRQDHRPVRCGSPSGSPVWWPKDDPNGPPVSGFGVLKMQKPVFPQDHRPTRRNEK